LATASLQSEMAHRLKADAGTKTEPATGRSARDGLPLPQCPRGKTNNRESHMRSVLFALTLWLLGGGSGQRGLQPANALTGNCSPCVQSAIDLPPVCAPTICPIAAPSLAPHRSDSSAAGYVAMQAGADLQFARQVPMAAGLRLIPTAAAFRLFRHVRNRAVEPNGGGVSRRPGETARRYSRWIQSSCSHHLGAST